jgi:sarcosine oxidase
MSFDVIVLGLGGMGSAAAYHLAGRGKRVLGIEQFTAPHDKGSSHGKTRVIRQAYLEGPAYVPLVLRAYELWRQLERETGRKLLFEVGGLMLGSPDSRVVQGSTRSAQQYRLEHEILDANEIRKRFPPIHPDADTVALYEKHAGYLRCEECVRAHLDQAAALGATLQFEENVTAWEPTQGGVRVRTSRGNYEAERLVITPGPWAPQVLAELNLPLVVDRQVLYWFDPIGGIEAFLPDRFPIYVWELPDGSIPYGFPAVDGPNRGVKVAFAYAPRQQVCTPETIERRVHEREIEEMRRAVVEQIPALNARCLDAVTCMYTRTPDHHFIITRHPEHPQVSIACGFSGHGFKFCSVVGEILADLATSGETRHDIGLFRLDRLSHA